MLRLGKTNFICIRSHPLITLSSTDFSEALENHKQGLQYYTVDSECGFWAGGFDFSFAIIKQLEYVGIWFMFQLSII